MSASTNTFVDFAEKFDNLTEFVSFGPDTIDETIRKSIYAKCTKTQIPSRMFLAIISATIKELKKSDTLFRLIRNDAKTGSEFWNGLLSTCDEVKTPSIPNFKLVIDEFVRDWLAARNNAAPLTQEQLKGKSKWVQKALAQPVPENPSDWIAARVAETHSLMEAALRNRSQDPRVYGNVYLDDQRYEAFNNDVLSKLKLQISISVESYARFLHKNVWQDSKWPEQFRVSARLFEVEGTNVVLNYVLRAYASDIAAITARWKVYAQMNPEAPLVKEYVAKQAAATAAKKKDVPVPAPAPSPASSNWADAEVEQTSRTSSEPTVVARFSYFLKITDNPEVRINPHAPFNPFGQSLEQDIDIKNEVFYAFVNEDSCSRNAFGCTKLLDEKNCVNFQQIAYMVRMTVYYVKLALHSLVRFYVEKDSARASQNLAAFSFRNMMIEFGDHVKEHPSIKSGLAYFFWKACSPSPNGEYSTFDEGFVLDFCEISKMSAQKPADMSLIAFCPVVNSFQPFQPFRNAIHERVSMFWISILFTNLLQTQRIDDMVMRESRCGEGIANTFIGEDYLKDTLVDVNGSNFISRLFAYTVKDKGYRPSPVNGPEQFTPYVQEVQKNMIEVDVANAFDHGKRGTLPYQGQGVRGGRGRGMRGGRGQSQGNGRGGKKSVFHSNASEEEPEELDERNGVESEVAPKPQKKQPQPKRQHKTPVLPPSTVSAEDVMSTPDVDEDDKRSNRGSVNTDDNVATDEE